MKERTDIQAGKLELYGRLEHLSSPVEWTQGLSNFFEWLIWEPTAIVGLSKTKFTKELVARCLRFINEEFKTENKCICEDCLNSLSGKLTSQLLKEASAQRVYNRCEKANEDKLILSSNEAFRKARFKSEDYLNKEFDIFLSLVPNHYLDCLYAEHFPGFELGNDWVTRGNSGQFGNGSGSGSMQMDNLAYNRDSQMLVGNELKLDAKKGKDQILKYLYLFLKLKTQPFPDEGPFINQDDKFRLLFFSPINDLGDVEAEIRRELQFVEKQDRNWAKEFMGSLREECSEISEKVKLMTWKELLGFNEEYLSSTRSQDETLRKLIWGFNQTLKEKCAIAETL